MNKNDNEHVTIEVCPGADLEKLKLAKRFGITLTPVQQAYFDELTEQRRIDRARTIEMQQLRLACEQETNRRQNPKTVLLNRVRPADVSGGTYLVAIESQVVHRALYHEVYAPSGLSFLGDDAEREALRVVTGLVLELDADEFEQDPHAAISAAVENNRYETEQWLRRALANGVEEMLNKRRHAKAKTKSKSKAKVAKPKAA
jgi:DNA-binding GntR family transcriptional regulator